MCVPFLILNMYGNIPERITREHILSRITEEDIFFKYMGIQPNTEDFFRNPFRADTHADCKFYRDNTLKRALKFNDFAYKWNVDCFNVVQFLYKLNYPQALEKIFRDFNLAEVVPDMSSNYNDGLITERGKEKSFLDIKVQRREIFKLDLDIWGKWGYTKETLSLLKIAPLLRVWVRGDIIYNFTLKDPGYVYHLGHSSDGQPLYKIYFPLREQGKFLQNTGDSLQGYHALPEGGDFLLITKSMKDVGCSFNYDIPSVAPMGETVLISPEQFEDLNNRFFRIFTLFDRDRAGMLASKLYQTTYGTIPLLFDSNNRLFRSKDEPKDFSDHHEAYGVRPMLDIIEHVKQIYL